MRIEISTHAFFDQRLTPLAARECVNVLHASGNGIRLRLVLLGIHQADFWLLTRFCCKGLRQLSDELPAKAGLRI